jgi:hypothetical protein
METKKKYMKWNESNLGTVYIYFMFEPLFLFTLAAFNCGTVVVVVVERMNEVKCTVANRYKIL